MINETLKTAESKMGKAVENTRSELTKIRTGKASPALLDAVRVEYYGTMVPLSQAATISTPEPRLLAIQPWDKNMFGPIEKAILQSELGLTPSNDGSVIRLPLPDLTEERRRDLVRLTKKLGEEGRISIRNVRRDANDHLKKAEKDHDISEDNMHDALAKIQEYTDKYVKQLDEVLKLKEEEIMEV